MVNALLTRQYKPLVTLGQITINGKWLCDTLELPWRFNQHDISCIPAGTYQIKWELSPHLGWCYFVKDVPGRGDVRIHTGNTVADILGCILVGNKYGTLNGKDAVLNSKTTLSSIKPILGDSFTLTII